MKKQLILFLALGLFVLGSCSSDDDGNENEASIVATWNLVSMTPAVWDLSCDSNSTFTFSESGTTSWTLYDANNECAAETGSGTWTNPSGSTYVVTIPGYDDVSGTVTFDGQTKFTFTGVVNYMGANVPVVLKFEK